MPLFMFGLGTLTGFALRDELTFPSYMRIKTSVIEHSLLTRKKLDPDVLAMIDPNTDRQLIQIKRDQIESAHDMDMETSQRRR